MISPTTNSMKLLLVLCLTLVIAVQHTLAQSLSQLRRQPRSQLSGQASGQSSSSGQIARNITISGTITAADGRPPKRADVRLLISGSDKPLQTVQADAKGLYSLRLKEAGAYRLAVSAPLHKTLYLPVVVGEQETTVHVSAVLAPNIIHPETDSLTIVGDWNGYNYKDAEPMKREPNGTYSYTLTTKNDTIGYQVIVMAKNKSEAYMMAGTMADYLLFDEGYRCVVKVAKATKGKPLVITFDPKQLMQPKRELSALPALTFDPQHQYLGQLLAIDKTRDSLFRQMNTAYRAFVASGGNQDAFTYDYAAFRELTRRIMLNTSNHAVLRQYAAVQLANPLPFGQVDSADMEAVKSLVPARSALWASAPMAAVEVFGSDTVAMKNFIAEQPNRLIAAKVLANAMLFASYRGQSENASVLYRELKNRFADVQSPEIAYALKAVNPEATIAKGKPVPEFSVKLLNSDQTVSNISLRGKYYMMDFWAVWCGPCRRELPSLHKVYEKFKSKLTLLSLSFDRRVGDIEDFRANTEWKMPWLHTFVEKGFDSPLAQTFEVQGIPKPILVAPDGTIVAVESELRGENLERTLEKFLGKQ